MGTTRRSALAFARGGTRRPAPGPFPRRGRSRQPRGQPAILLDVSSHVIGSVIDDELAVSDGALADAQPGCGLLVRVLIERTPQVRVNLQYLAQFRRDQCVPPHTQDIVEKFRTGWTVQDLIDAVPAASVADARTRAMNLLWHRELVVDLSRRLTKDSPVSVPALFGLEAVDAIQ